MNKVRVDNQSSLWSRKIFVSPVFFMKSLDSECFLETDDWWRLSGCKDVLFSRGTTKAKDHRNFQNFTNISSRRDTCKPFLTNVNQTKPMQVE